MNTIFQVGDKDWSQQLYTKTPVELVGSMLFKRDDYFAPFGYGGINGSKLRQCIWLMKKFHNDKYDTVVSGSSVKSPQISMSALVARHFGMKAIEVVGATKPDTAMQHENVRIGAGAGAKFVINLVAYNPALQRRADKLVSEAPGRVRLEYGISLPKEEQDIVVKTFHTIGGAQVMNIPPEVETLIIPFGSGNSAISILFGLWNHKPKGLKRVILATIGPNKFQFLKKRLQQMDALEVLDDYTIDFWDIHGTGYATYSDEMPAEYEGIDFHPTYEGKVFNYLKEKEPALMVPSTLFWIVGSKPYYENMAQFLSSVPELLPLL